MAFPDDLTMVTVTHPIADAALRPLPGVVVATPTGRQWKQGEGSILPAEYTAPIEDGVWTLVLPAVDQFVNLEAYRIEERPTEGGKPWGRPYHIAPELEHAPGPVDATDVYSDPPRGGDINKPAGPATDESMAQVAADPNSAFHGELTSTIDTAIEQLTPADIGARSNEESIYIDTGAFVATLGNPVRDHVHRLARWNLSRGQEIGAVMLDAIPTGWQTARLDVMWANGGDEGGDVRLAARAGVFAVGDTLAQPPVLSHTLAAADRDVLTRSVLFPEFDVSKGVVGVAVQRVSSSLDTLPEGISFFGLVIERLT